MKITLALRIGLALLPIIFVSPASATTALQITVQVDAGTPVTITDSNDIVNDLNAGDGVIDFTTTVDGVLQADGRVEQASGPLRRFLTLSSQAVGGGTVFHNLDTIGHTVTVTVDSDTFVAPGPPLGWHVTYEGTADDASGADVEISPLNDVTGYVDAGAGFGSPLNTSPVSFPITPPVAAIDQPVVIDVGQRGIDATGDAIRSRLVWVFDAGPDDEIRLPDSASSDAVSMVVFNSENFCVVKMNKDGTNVVQKSETNDIACFRGSRQHHGTGDATACVDTRGAAKDHTIRSENRLLEHFATFCAIPPAFGVNLDTCCAGGANDGEVCSVASECASGACTPGACISGAAQDAVNAITHDLFGATVNISDSPIAGCQIAVETAASHLHQTRWKALADCKRRDISSFATEADFVTTCLGRPQFVRPPNRIATTETKLGKTVQRACINHSIGPLSTVFPGACASETDADYAACIARRIACRFCLGTVDADDIISPVDCDLFDDGTANASCP